MNGDHTSSTEGSMISNDSVTGKHTLGEPQPFHGAKEGKDIEEIPESDVELRSFMEEELTRRMSSRQLADELMSEANKTDAPLPSMGSGKPYPPALPDREPYIVDFDGPNDPLHPYNYPLKKKMLYSLATGYAAFNLTFGSGTFSQTLPVLVELYKVGPVVATLGTSLYVMGFASGPVLFGPLSELYGRKPVLVISTFGYMCFSFAVATGKDLQTLLICRFFAGFIGSAALVIAPASMADIYSPQERGTAIAFVAMLIFAGPTIAPVVGGYIMRNASLGWRWTSYIDGIIGVLAFLLSLFAFGETHHPILLVSKAETLRRRTGNWGIIAPHEEVKPNMKEITQKYLTRPLYMLVTEPIIFFVTIYHSFIYGMLYLFLTAIPLIFAKGYHFKAGNAELPYLSMLVGIIIGSGIIVYFNKKAAKKIAANGGKPLPEEMLPPMMIGGVVFAIGLFWLGWTGDYPEHIHWIVPTIGTCCLGCGLILVFVPCLSYIIYCYLTFAASAVAGNTFLRSAFGAVFPLFARQMFNKLTIKWALTLLGCVAVILIPVPFLFYKFGRRYREKSKFAVVF